MSSTAQRKIVLVPGSGFGGYCDDEFCEFGKLGTNPGTDALTGRYPQTTATYDFASEAAIKANFAALHSAKQIADLRDGRFEANRRIAADVFTAQARVLADTMRTVCAGDGDEFYFGGGILQDSTRRFVISEAKRRSRRIGMRLRQIGDGVAVDEFRPETPFAAQLERQSGEGSSAFLRRTLKMAVEYFKPVDSTTSLAALRRYIPPIGVDEVLAAHARCFLDERERFDIEAGDSIDSCWLPTSGDIHPEVLTIIACAVLCKLQTRAMLGGYEGESNIEAAIKEGNCKSVIPGPLAEVIPRVYREQGFSVLIEDYRSLAMTRRQENPPVRMSEISDVLQRVRRGERFGVMQLLGLDIGAQSWKAVIAEFSNGELVVRKRINARPIPRGCAPAEFFVQIAEGLLSGGGQLEEKPIDACCIAWPGCVDGRGPAQYSGIVSQLEGMPNSIQATTSEDLDQVDIKQLWGQAWERVQETNDISICVVNDGTAFGAYYTNRDLVSGTTELSTRFHGAVGACFLALAPVADDWNLRRPR